VWCIEVIENIQFVNIYINALRIDIIIVSHILYIEAFGSERTWWSVFQKLVVCTKLDIYVLLLTLSRYLTSTLLKNKLRL